MRCAATIAATLVCAMVAAGPASARFTSPTLTSSSQTEQAATGVVGGTVSGEGAYAVFETTSRNLATDPDPNPAGGYNEGGIFRKDLATGALELVARGDRFDNSGSRVTIGAKNPSVSADGRFVAFSTEESLRATDTNGRIDVYVRDMTVPIDAPIGQFDLVSSPNGSAEAGRYGAGQTANSGANVPTRSAISADGRKVAFVTEAASNIPTGGVATNVAAGQVLVRDLDFQTTTLASAKRDQGAGEMTGLPAGGGDAKSIALSADGSTVVWSGTQAPDQTLYLQGESPNPTVAQLLWRRVADVPVAATRRVLPQGDPDDSGCPPDGVVTSSGIGPCQGPMPGNGTAPSFSVSADGRRVAVTSRDSPRGAFKSPALSAQFIDPVDLFVVDMSTGLTRKAGFRELTREGLEPKDPDVTDIKDVAISADGHWVALATERTVFGLPSLTQVGTPSVAFTLGIDDIYVADLDAGTIELVTRALDGGKPNGRSSTPWLSADGGRLAFSSRATNLFPDGTTQGDDLFVADRIDEGGEPASEELPPPLEPVEITSRDNLPVTVESGANGWMRVHVLTPGAGTVRATAVVRRGTVGSARKRATEAGRVTLALKPAKRFRSLARRRGGLPVTLKISFAPRPAGSAKTLRRSLAARFRAAGKKR